jgi:hypothetical protein
MSSDDVIRSARRIAPHRSGTPQDPQRGQATKTLAVANGTNTATDLSAVSQTFADAIQRGAFFSMVCTVDTYFVFDVTSPTIGADDVLIPAGTICDWILPGQWIATKGATAAGSLSIWISS